MTIQQYWDAIYCSLAIFLPSLYQEQYFRELKDILTDIFNVCLTFYRFFGLLLAVI